MIHIWYFCFWKSSLQQPTARNFCFSVSTLNWLHQLLFSNQPCITFTQLQTTLPFHCRAGPPSLAPVVWLTDVNYPVLSWPKPFASAASLTCHRGVVEIKRAIFPITCDETHLLACGQNAKWYLSYGSVALFLKEFAYVISVFIPKVSLSLM